MNVMCECEKNSVALSGGLKNNFGVLSDLWIESLRNADIIHAETYK